MHAPSLPTATTLLWKMMDGSSVSCNEKLKVLNQNHEEIRQMCQEAYEDALLMGCDPHHFRSILHDMISSLTSSFDMVSYRHHDNHNV